MTISDDVRGADVLTRDEAIDRMKAGLPCETFLVGADRWAETDWPDFKRADHKFRKPPEPRREAREWWVCNNGFTTSFPPEHDLDAIHVREVLPGEVSVQRMTEAQARQQWRDWWSMQTGKTSTAEESWLASRRALGLIGEGS